MSADDNRLTKRATGIDGLDAVTRGGLPAAGATLVIGGAGAGKTILGLQLLAGAIERGEGGVFVSFEESPAQIRRSAASFDWGEALTASDRLALLDARPPAEAVAGGAFDLQGLTAAAGEQVRRLGAGWLVIDGIDRLLRLQPDVHTAVDEIARLGDWCEAEGISLVLTGKRTDPGSDQPAYLEGVEFMLSAVIVLSTELVGRRLNRRFRIAKYRGTEHATDELAMVLDDAGMHLPYDDKQEGGVAAATTERVGVGIPRLDELLGGGVYRGSTTLISGQPGTAKTTLAVAFARAGAERGERVLYLSFDELADRIVRNVASVGIDLQPHIDAGHLVIRTREAWRWLIEEHFVELLRLLDEHEPDAIVIDPVSALLKSASAETAYATTERLLSHARARGITSLMTSLTESDRPAAEATLSHTSTLADTWITLDYNVRGGERNRALSIVKSRGTAHSNQLRELMLSGEGIDLADAYEYGSEVLMGTARLQKQGEEAERMRRRRSEREQRRHELQRRIEEARGQMRDAESEAQRLEAELKREHRDEADADAAEVAHLREVRQRRSPGRNPGSDGAADGGGEDDA